MRMPRMPQVPRPPALVRRTSLWLAALWLAAAACFLTACDLVPFGQPQHSGPPPHTLFVSYLMATKPLTTPSNLVNNPIDYVVAAMTMGDGKTIWKTTVPGVLKVGKNGTPEGGARRDRVVVSGPIVYAMIDLGTRGVLAALDAYTGSLLWTHIEETNPIFEVKAAKGIVFIQSGLHTLQALDGQSGRRLWQLSSGTYYSLGSFAIASQTVYIVNQSFGPERLHDADTSTYYFIQALHASDGKEIWRTRVEQTENTVGYQLQADDQRVYVLKPSYATGVNLPGTVVALRAQDGNALWTYQEPGFTEGDFELFANTLVGQTLYLIPSPVTALDAQSGKLLWTYDTRFHVTQFFPPDHLYGETLEPGEEFCWLRLTDGAKQWCAPLSPASRIVADANNLYFLGYQASPVSQAPQAYVMVVSQSDGHVVNQYLIGDERSTSPGDLAGVA